MVRGELYLGRNVTQSVQHGGERPVLQSSPMGTNYCGKVLSPSQSPSHQQRPSTAEQAYGHHYCGVSIGLWCVNRAHNHLRRTTAPCDEMFHCHWRRRRTTAPCNGHVIGNATDHGQIATHTAVSDMRVELGHRCITLLIFHFGGRHCDAS